MRHQGRDCHSHTATPRRGIHSAQCGTVPLLFTNVQGMGTQCDWYLLQYRDAFLYLFCLFVDFIQFQNFLWGLKQYTHLPLIILSRKNISYSFFSFQAGPPGERAIGLSQFLKNVLTSAEVLLPSDLCIAPNKVSIVVDIKERVREFL